MWRKISQHLFLILLFLLFSSQLSAKLSEQSKHVSIPAIQGESHISSYQQQLVTTRGIVTAIQDNRFYLQDALGDGNDLTADAVLVITNSSPKVELGDLLEITGIVKEYTARKYDLSITTLKSRSLKIISHHNSLPQSITIGASGRNPPTEIIDSDRLNVFNPQTDAIDFYESLEGMRVTIPQTLTITPPIKTVRFI